MRDLFNTDVIEIAVV